VSRARAVVFAHHDVGVRCLKALISAGVEIPLVVTVRDDPRETQWYASVAATAARHGLTVIAPAEASESQLERALGELQPDFIFSFYYRSLLAAPLLAAARHGALNMHGSLLPKFRGRAPVKLGDPQGRARNGRDLCTTWSSAPMPATSSISSPSPSCRMTTPREVFAKVTVAAETILARSLPALIAGTAPRRAQVIEPVSTSADAAPRMDAIDWSRPRWRSTTWCGRWRRRSPARSRTSAGCAGRSAAPA